MLLSAAVLSLAALSVSASEDDSADVDSVVCVSYTDPNGDVLTVCTDHSGAVIQSVRTRGTTGGF